MESVQTTPLTKQARVLLIVLANRLRENTTHWAFDRQDHAPETEKDWSGHPGIAEDTLTAACDACHRMGVRQGFDVIRAAVMDTLESLGPFPSITRGEKDQHDAWWAAAHAGIIERLGDHEER